ncbi:MAG: SIMPL domain-containing protein [Bacteroidales bacterium]|nr:SIMPL domain-containing protein [Bacteroidales bacterium]
MNTKNVIVSALLIMLGLVIGLVGHGVFVKSGIGSYADKDRYVSVKGLSEHEVKADHVIWPIVFKEVGNNLTELYSTVNGKNKFIVNFLKENGISENEISVAPISADDREADRWSTTEIPYRYQLKSVITVASDQVDKVRDLISRQDEFFSAGITCESSWEHQTSFSFNGLNELKPEMVEEATRNARAVAEKFAADSESTLGGIKTASQGQFSIYDRDENTPYIKMVRVVTTIEYFLK